MSNNPSTTESKPNSTSSSIEEFFNSFQLRSQDSQNTLHSVQNEILIWLDINIVKDSDSYQATTIPLQSVIHNIFTYADSEACFQFIQTISNEKVCLLISGSIGQFIVPRIHHMTQVDSIVVYCGDVSRHRPWAAAWSKIKGVFNDIIPVREALKQATELCEQNSIPISLLETKQLFDPSLICTRIFKEIFLGIEFDAKHLVELTNHCRTLFANNNSTLKDVINFEENYRLHSPIWWYTYDSFLRRMLNCALSHLNVELIVKLAFFIVELHQQIEQLHKEQRKNRLINKTFVTFRGQGISLLDFQRMREMKNGLISFNNFLSTTKNGGTVFELAQRTSSNPDLVGILFRMTIDPSKSTVPFAITKDVNCNHDQEEFLFSINAMFRIGEIQPIDENDRIFQVDLALTNDTDEELETAMDRIREETYPQSTGWHRLGLLLLKLGAGKQADQIYQMLVDQASDEQEKASIYHQQGRAKHFQKKYRTALQVFQRSMEIYQKILPATHPDLATLHYHMGLVYQNMENHAKALASHEKALEIRQKSLPSDHADLACSYDELGRIHFNTRDYQKSIVAYDKLLIIRQQTLPVNHSDLMSVYDHLGEVYQAMNKCFKSISFYEKSLEIKEQLLPSNHPELAAAYKTLGNLLYNVREFGKALPFYEKVRDVLQRTVPPNYLELVISYSNIGLTYENMGDYIKASSAYERAANIGEKAALTEKLIVQKQQKNLDRVKKLL